MVCEAETGGRSGECAEMKWGTLPVQEEEDGVVSAVHVLPCGDDGTPLLWHTASELCGCNPRVEVNSFGVNMYLHHEDSQEGVADGNGS